MAWALKLPLADEVIESGLVQDFDASLSGIGQELGAGAYSMSKKSQVCPLIMRIKSCLFNMCSVLRPLQP